MSDDVAWKKDETPYLIFKCAKCKQYLYVKKSQKTKKCLRCGHLHKVSNYLNSGEGVYGLSNAIQTVKKRQHELALKEEGPVLEFRGSQEFRIVKSQKDSKSQQNNDINTENELIDTFKKMLIGISKRYKEFPNYIIEIMAENYDISHSEVKLLTRYLLKEGFLNRQENYLYSINKI